MKICLLAPANNPHTQKIAYTLSSKGYKVVICTFHNAMLDGIVVKYFSPHYNLLGKANYLLNLPTIKNYLKEIKPDILHAHYVSSYGVVGYLTRYRPLIISVWGMDIYEATRNFFLQYMIKKSLRNADYVLSTSNTMAKRIKHFVERNIIVTPFGVNLSKFYPRPKQTTNKFIIGTARRLSPKYGLDYLIRAFSVFANMASDAELHIAGDGPQRNELITLATNLKIDSKVKFYGFVSPQLMPEFLSNLDVFVIPSISESESFGVAALEAQACGI
ncbi:MAG: glycosyltransferase, partial [bacterium]